MPIESATYISQLDAANPSGSDQVADGDNHIRLIKQSLKTTFPNITGAVQATQSDLQRTVPIGGIIMWSGALTAIPTGWVLCAGQTGLTRTDGGGTISAPDLRAKFVFGAGDPTGGTGYQAPGSTGGSLLHNHTGTVSGTAISVAQMPLHGHGVTDPGHAHGVVDPGHAHSFPFRGNFATIGSGAFGAWQNETTGGTNVSFTGISIAAAATGISIQGNGGGQTHDHGLTINNVSTLPPYMALAYIMRI